MDDNSLLLIIFAFILGYMGSGMMKSMCGYNLVEGSSDNWKCEFGLNYDSKLKAYSPGCKYGTLWGNIINLI